MKVFEWVGGGVALAGLFLIAVEVALIVPRGIRLTKRISQLNLLLAEHLRLSGDELETLQQTRSDMHDLLGPYRRVLRWLRHPITLALLASYRRRLVRRGSSTSG